MISRKIIVGIGVCAIVFLYQFYQFNILQDDAFISFRYIRNFLDGHGLVFNIGERVEGYTNFLWIILLSLLTKLGLPLIETSRVLGILSGIATIVLSAYAAHKLYPKRNWLWILSVPLLLAANGAFAYWAGSGLETGLFTLLAAASAITYLTNPPLSLLLVTLATLTRPEGALLAFLFGIAGILLKQKSWKATLTYWGALAVLMIPYAVFKWFYFGSLLPNPFYAKTGFSTEYWQSGAEYVFHFFKHYALYGLALVPPLLFWKKMATFSRFLFLVFAGYVLYIMAVGGDVLLAHRFFIPILVFFFFPVADAVYQALPNRRFRESAFAAIVILLGVWCWRFPFTYLGETARGQRVSLDYMIKAARFLARDQNVKSLAVSAIGAISYYLQDRRIIDMLGLTEPTIAKNPERIEGLESSWRERNFNAGYVLSQKPDVILFSTGLKPSALAERALFLYPGFRQNYRLEVLYQEGSFNNYYRRFQDRPVENRADQPAIFVNLFNESLNWIRRDRQNGIELLRESIARGPKDCAALYTVLGSYYFLSAWPESADVYLKKGMELDAGGSISRYWYATLLYAQKDYTEAARQDSILTATVPNIREYLRSVRVSPR